MKDNMNALGGTGMKVDKYEPCSLVNLYKAKYFKKLDNYFGVYSALYSYRELGKITSTICVPTPSHLSLRPHPIPLPSPHLLYLKHYIEKGPK